MLNSKKVQKFQIVLFKALMQDDLFRWATYNHMKVLSGIYVDW